MRITICCKQFAERGGAERFLVNFARCLVADGHQVTVLTPFADAPPEGVQIRRLHVPWTPHAFHDLALARASAKALASDDADVTFSDQKCWGAQVVRPGGGVQRAYVRQRERSYPTALTRAANCLLRALSVRERLRIYIDDRLYAPPGPRCVIANSDMVRRDLIEYYPHLEGRIRVVYNGADLEQFSPALRERHRETIRKELGVPADALLVAFVSHDWRRKGLHTLIRAIGLLAHKGQPVYAVVVGRGNRLSAERFARKAGALDLMRFAGATAPEPYYGAADVMALPSFYDPCANVTIEALACGLPVITTVTNGAFEMLHPGVNGFCLDDASDARQLAHYIERFSDQGFLDAASRSARELAQGYPLDWMYAQILDAVTGL